MMIIITSQTKFFLRLIYIRILQPYGTMPIQEIMNSKEYNKHCLKDRWTILRYEKHMSINSLISGDVFKLLDFIHSCNRMKEYDKGNQQDTVLGHSCYI